MESNEYLIEVELDSKFFLPGISGNLGAYWLPLLRYKVID